MSSDPHAITTQDQITAVLGEAPEFIRAKLLDHVDEHAATFIAGSPLAFVATIDPEGAMDVSPKGDAPGFVQVTDQSTLLIPERKGNHLAFGPRNIVATGRIGLIFVVPGQRETLRVNGSATLTTDPDLLEQLSAQGKPSLLCTTVHVEECFFHCGKAFIRSKLWNPETWDDRTDTLLVKQTAAAFGGEEAEAGIAAALEANYVEELY